MKKHRLQLASLFILLLFFGNACTPVLYVPPTQNVSLPNKKGDSDLTASYGLRGAALQYTGAASNMLFVAAQLRGLSYQRTAEANSYLNITQSNLRHRESSGDLGLGLYGRFGGQRFGAWSILAGGGLGRTAESPLNGNAFVHSSANYRRIFFQPAIGLATPRFQLALSCQAAWIKIGSVRSGNPAYDGRTFSPFTIEPAVTLCFGGEWVKFFAQAARTWEDSNQQHALRKVLSIDLQSVANLTIGVRFHFGKQPAAGAAQRQ